MSISAHFFSLGAPLRNIRWSWGAVRNSDGAIFLRVWRDEKIHQDRRSFMRVTAHAHFVDRPQNLGWRERLRQVEEIKGGAIAYMIVCDAVDPSAVPRTIRKFDNKTIFLGGELLEYEGDSWLELAKPIAVSEAAMPK